MLKPATFGGSQSEKIPWPSTSAMMRSSPRSAPARVTSATGFCRPKYAEFTSLSSRAVIAGSVAMTFDTSSMLELGWRNVSTSF
jgi:hypothetical protein